jgi:hypothetical protein
MPKYKQENLDKVISIDYGEFVEKLYLEVGDLIREMRMGKTQRYSCFKARKKTKRIAELLKMYRMVSIKHEDKINTIVKKNKINLVEELKDPE